MKFDCVIQKPYSYSTTKVVFLGQPCTCDRPLSGTDQILENSSHSLPLLFKLQEVWSVLWRCWLVGRKGKKWVVGCWHGYLEWGADLHMAQWMPLPLTISCSSKSRLVLPSWFLPSWYLLTWIVPDKFQKSRKTIVCVCVSVSVSSVNWNCNWKGKM